MGPEVLVGNCVEEICKAREEKIGYIYEPYAGLGISRQAVKTAGTLYESQKARLRKTLCRNILYTQGSVGEGADRLMGSKIDSVV